MKDRMYHLECNHIQKHSRPVKLIEGQLWCKNCRRLVMVMRIVSSKDYIQKKLVRKAKTE